MCWQCHKYGETAAFSALLKNAGNYMHKSSAKIALLAKSSTLITLLCNFISGFPYLYIGYCLQLGDHIQLFFCGEPHWPHRMKVVNKWAAVQFFLYPWLFLMVQGAALSIQFNHTSFLLWRYNYLPFQSLLYGTVEENITNFIFTMGVLGTWERRVSQFYIWETKRQKFCSHVESRPFEDTSGFISEFIYSFSTINIS